MNHIGQTTEILGIVIYITSYVSNLFWAREWLSCRSKPEVIKTFHLKIVVLVKSKLICLKRIYRMSIFLCYYVRVKIIVLKFIFIISIPPDTFNIFFNLSEIYYIGFNQLTWSLLIYCIAFMIQLLKCKYKVFTNLIY